METLFSIFVGIGLSAAVGFRIFVPFLVVSIAAYNGFVDLSLSTQWIGTLPAMIVFVTATLFEILAYYIPWLDNLLDTIATPAAVVAGIILSAAVITDISPLIKWVLAIIAGGGVAASVQLTTDLTRIKSSAVTGGTGNFIVSSAEAGSSIGLSLIAIFLPVAAAVIVLFFVGWSIYFIRKKFFSPARRKN